MASTSSNNSIIQTSSSSSSSALVTSTRKNYYDVFVSFSGKDTCLDFTDHLFAAFQRNGIVAFREDTKLNKGESIAPELLRAIQDSEIFIVVLSKNYASSTLCLRELESILECVQLSGKRVLPVFYDVDPSEVRYQKGTYGEAFAKHELRFKQDYEMVKRWKEALTQVANLSGWDLHDKPQYAEIGKIVEDIISISSHKFSSLPKDLVGMHSPIKELEKQLLLNSVDDVRVVGICGMGGIGKTTLATVLYNKISNQFSACCFIDDLSKFYRDTQCNLYNTSNLIQSRLHNVKSLIILDTVDQVEQLEKLDVTRESLGAGSRIIIVSRDEHILKKYGVDVVYKVPLLNETDSLQLFRRKAFKLDHVVSSYSKLALDILRYTNGLPLAIKVLGSFLFGRDISEWESALARIGERPHNDIKGVLQLSFDGLEEMEKEIFLHIACFFNHHMENYVKKVLNCCGFHVDNGFRVLTDKSLISISESNHIEMSRLLVDLGRNIAEENTSKKSRKWSKVWLQEQFYNAMLENTEQKVEAIFFVGDHREKNILIVGDSLSKMSHLRLLILKGVNFSGNLSCLSNKLRYVEWDRYPLTYLPSSFEPNQLVELILKHSSIKKLWKEKKYLPNLKTLDLSHSKNLRKMPNFGEVPNLERISFEGCVKLVQMDPSIGVLTKLVYLNLKDCKNLVSIPNNIYLISLGCLNLSGCRKVFMNSRHLNKSENASRFQSTMSSILKWTMFYFFAYRDLASCLSGSLLRFYCLHKLDISFCGLIQLPDAIGCLHWLEELNLGGNNFVTLPSFWELSKLVYLNLEHCKMLESLPQLPFPMAITHDLRISNIDMTNIWKRVGLIIFNCPKLGESEHCSSMAFSWMAQLIQARQQSSAASFHEIIDIVIPGSEMPILFNNKSEGDSIRIDLSPIIHDSGNYFGGIACCAVFSVAPVDPTRTTTHAQRPEIELYILNSKTHFTWHVIIPIMLERYLIEVKSDHICLIYFPLESFFSILKWIDLTLSHLDHFNMKVRIKNGEGIDLLVQNCGYHWVCKQDDTTLQKFVSS